MGNKLFAAQRRARLEHPENYTEDARSSIRARDFSDLPWNYKEGDKEQIGDRYKDLGDGLLLWEERPSGFSYALAKTDAAYLNDVRNRYKQTPYALWYDEQCEEMAKTVEQLAKVQVQAADPFMATVLKRLEDLTSDKEKLEAEVKKLKKSAKG